VLAIQRDKGIEEGVEAAPLTGKLVPQIGGIGRVEADPEQDEANIRVSVLCSARPSQLRARCTRRPTGSGKPSRMRRCFSFRRSWERPWFADAEGTGIGLELLGRTGPQSSKFGAATTDLGDASARGARHIYVDQSARDMDRCVSLQLNVSELEIVFRSHDFKKTAFVLAVMYAAPWKTRCRPTPPHGLPHLKRITDNIVRCAFGRGKSALSAR
jgi:hypothetical protein